jgi:hypothetical protein
MLRRFGLGLATAVALHALVVLGVAGWALYRGAVAPTVDIELASARTEPLHDLPLGPSAHSAEKLGRSRAPSGAHGPVVRPRAATAATRENGAARARTEDPPWGDEEDGAPRVSDLRQLGPEDGRLTVLVRLDRLKATPFAAMVDRLLMRLPDRRDLLEGTGLGLYEDFDALLVSTPNPADQTVTFLAARHHLGDGAIRAAIDRGARSTNHGIDWRTEGGRPYGERRAGTAPGHDDRIIVLAAPGLVVVTPPAYRDLLLAPVRRPTVDSGAPTAGDAGEDDSGGDDGTSGDRSSPAPSWRALLRRIDAEEGPLPPSGIAMVSAVEVLRPTATRQSAIFAGLDVPRVLTATVTAEDGVSLDVDAEFVAEPHAEEWERAWPMLQRKLLANPAVVLSGASALVARVTLTRDGNVVHLHEAVTVEETSRLLEVLLRTVGG